MAGEPTIHVSVGGEVAPGVYGRVDFGNAPPPPVPTEELEAMLTRLRLPAIRDRLDALLEEAARRELNLREALAWLLRQSSG